MAVTTTIPLPQSEEAAGGSTGFVYLIAAVAALGGLLFGYDTGVMTGAIVFMEPRFHLGPEMMGWVVSCALIGCILGSPIAGMLSDRFGRKNILVLSALLFSVSAVASAIPPNIPLFSIARIAAGIAIGIASVLSPLYISEISPADSRGRLVSLNQLAIVTGFLLVYFVNLGITGFGNATWNIEYGWRWMFACSALPSLLFLGLLFILPESPRWLAKQERVPEAEAILTRIGGQTHARAELTEIRNTCQAESASISQLLQPGLRLALLVGLILAVLQQITGINTIMYYAPKIFKSSGASTDAALFSTVLVGAVNLLFTFVALWLIDKAGRKILLLAGSTGMAVSMAGISALFYLNYTQGPWLLICVLTFIASFAASQGPVVWVVINEIFPTKIRGRAVSIATMVLWVATYAVAQLFPMMLAYWGPVTTFAFFAITSLAAILFVARWVPETKGKSLEAIEAYWKH